MPDQEDADVTGHAPGKVDDLSPDLVTAQAQVLVPELVHVLRDPGEGVFQPGSA